MRQLLHQNRAEHKIELLQGGAIVITKWVSFTTKWTRFLKYEARANKTWGK